MGTNPSKSGRQVILERKHRRAGAHSLRILLAVAALLGASYAGLGRAEAAIPTLSAGSDTVFVGDTFSIPISIANASGLTSFQFDLGFDHTLLRAVSFDDSATDFATAVGSGGSLTGITGFIDNTTGILSGVADSMFTFGPVSRRAAAWSTSPSRRSRPGFRR